METTAANFVRKLILLAALIIVSGCQPQTTQQFEQTSSGAFAGDLSAFGKYSAMSTQESVTLWDQHKAKILYRWSHHPGYRNSVHCVALSDDNQIALTANNTEFALWNMQTGANKAFYSIDNDLIRSCAVAKQGQYIALGMISGNVLFIDIDSGRRLYFLGHKERISEIAISANGQYVLSGSYDGSALLWRTQDAQVVYDFSLQGRITKVSLDRLGRYAFTANSTNQSQIWDLSNGQAIAQLKYLARQQIFSAVSFSHNGQWLATGAPGQKVKIWSLKTGELVYTHPFIADNFSATVLDFAFSADDSELLLSISSGKLQRLNLNQLEQP